MLFLFKHKHITMARKLIVFNSISLDGYFSGVNGDISWAHKPGDDAEWTAFVQGNAGEGGVLVFGRVTYEMMAGYWPTPHAASADPQLAAHMNSLQKIVFSRSLDKASWENTKLLTNLADDVRRLKNEPGDDMVILGSGSIVSQLTQAGLIDEYQVVINPVLLGAGKTMFEGIDHAVGLKLTNSRTFKNGNVVLTYKAGK